MQRMARMELDWTLKKLGQLFQVLIWITPKKFYGLVLSGESLHDILFTTLQEHFVYGQRHLVMTSPQTGPKNSDNLVAAPRIQ